MYSAHHSPTQELVINRRSSSTTQSKPTAPLKGFTWSHNPATPSARTSSLQEGIVSTSQDGEQPRKLYSKLYERFIEKREVFVHSNIDVRRSASIKQAQDRSDLSRQSTTPRQCSSPSSSTHPPFPTSYPGIVKAPHEDDAYRQGYWELSNNWPAENYSAPSPTYYSADPGAMYTLPAIPEPPHSGAHLISPHPVHHSPRQLLPAQFHSSYSELSANVAFLSETKSHSTKASNSGSPSGPATRSATPQVPSPESLSGIDIGLPIEPTTEPSTSNRSATQPRSIARRKNTIPDSGTSSPRASSNKVSSGKKGNEARRQPSLACFFCRERKIACGRPAEGSIDRTCNQCARRSFPCDYPTESMRGQHKRRKTRKDGN